MDKDFPCKIRLFIYHVSMDRFLNEVLKNIRKYDMIRPGDEIVVGFSGGADSVCLLFSLKELKAILGIKSLMAVHINHGLRGEEARRDEDFCRELCRDWSIDFEAVHADVRGLARELGLSIEEAGRKVRYESFSARLSGKGAIATAHHADDCAETILLNLARGTGLRGAAGISPKNGNIIRPLCFLSKQEILAYVEGRKLSYVTDSTNLTNEYTRNVIRNEILPLFSEQVNLRTQSHIVAFGDLCREADEFISGLSHEFLRAHASISKEAIRLDKALLKEKPRIFRRYVIMNGLRSSGASLKDLTELHFEAADRALFSGRGYHADLPGGICVENINRETCIFIRED